MPDRPAFVANGFPVSVAARDACLAVMRREQFTTGDTVQAMIAHGVPAADYTAERAADRIRQSERRAGRIRPGIGRGAWERVS